MSENTEANAESELHAAAEEAAQPDASPSLEFNGETYVIDLAATRSLDFVEDLLSWTEGRGTVLPRLVKHLIGAEQYATLKAGISEASADDQFTALRDFWDKANAAAVGE